MIEVTDASGLSGFVDRWLAPATPEEAALYLKEASEQGIPVTVSGSGTGVTGGRIPSGGGWELSLEKLRRCEIGEGSATVGAGLTLEALQAAARQTGQFYPPDPTEWTASLGGNIATNASGSRSFRYGSTRPWVESLTVAFADGRLRTFRKGDKLDFPYRPLPPPLARKHTAGYYLRENTGWIDLICGSEGTLCVVLEAEVRLLPEPKSMLSGIIFFPSEPLSTAVVEAWREIPQLRMLEFMDGASLGILREALPEIPAAAEAALMIEQELDGLPGDAVDDWVDRLESSGALTEESWFGETAQDRERFRRARHTLPELVNERVRRNGFQKFSSDFAVPLDRNLEMMRWYRQQLDEHYPRKSVLFGHIGDAHVHVNLLPETEDDASRGREWMTEAAKQSVALGGTVSAEHGLGKKKRHLLSLEFTAAQIEAMRAVKSHLDPRNILGRGTLFPD